MMDRDGHIFSRATISAFRWIIGVVLVVLSATLDSASADSGVSLPSGLQVYATGSRMTFRLPENLSALVNSSNAIVSMCYIDHKCSEFNPNLSEYSAFRNDVFNFSFIGDQCYTLRLCHRLGETRALNCKRRASSSDWSNCANAERFAIEEVYRPEAPQLKGTIALTAHSVVVECDVAKPNKAVNVVRMEQLLYMAEVVCLNKSKASEAAVSDPLVWRLNSTGSCRLAFEDLPPHSAYQMTISAKFGSSPYTSPPLNLSFRTPLAPPKRNPAIIGYEMSDSRLRLIVAPAEEDEEIIYAHVNVTTCPQRVAQSETKQSSLFLLKAVNSCSTGTVTTFNVTGDWLKSRVLSLMLPKQGDVARHVQLRVSNDAGFSRATPIETFISGSDSQDLNIMKFETFDVFEIDDSSFLFCWSVKFHSDFRLPPQLYNSECINELALKVTEVTLNRTDTLSDQVFNQSMEVQFDFLICSPDATNCDQLLSTSQRRSSLIKAGSGAALLRYNRNDVRLDSLLFGVSASLWNSDGHELHRARLQHGSKCNYSTHQLNQTLTFSMNSTGNSVTLNIPWNDCRTSPTWILNHSVSVRCKDPIIDQMCYENVSVITYLPGVLPQNKSHLVEFHALPDGCNCEIRVISSSFKGSYHSFDGSFRTVGFHLYTVLRCVGVSGVLLIFIVCVVCYAWRQHQRNRCKKLRQNANRLDRKGYMLSGYVDDNCEGFSFATFPSPIE